MRTIPVIICLDVEPNDREISAAAAGDWDGFEEAIRYFTGLRPRLEKATGARASFSWFLRMDPQIEHIYGLSSWVVKRYGEAIEGLARDGDEIGLHAHARRWDTGHLRWLIDHGDQEWINHCLRSSFDAYRSALGRDCRSFRFGDKWMNNESMALLETLGVKFDLTVEPGQSAKPSLSPRDFHTGSLPDYMSAPRWPYRPSPDDFRKESPEPGPGLWVIPLSTCRVLGRFAAFKRVAMAFGLFRRGREARQLNLGLSGPLFQVMVNRLLKRPGNPYLAPVARTDIGTHPIARPNVEQNLNFLLSHPLVNNFRFVGPAEAVELLLQSSA